ncbi:MAG: hypothetical protein UY96_C0037G0011 [Parcubacteria group bacterium GW2011_GWB1_56_8]|nr:MAG: hypothetical protein UY96_C0037G0011 [Parcubacteria group bacterium GW2011_GWB1_56_8]
MKRHRISHESRLYQECTRKRLNMTWFWKGVKVVLVLGVFLSGFAYGRYGNTMPTQPSLFSDYLKCMNSCQADGYSYFACQKVCEVMK